MNPVYSTLNKPENSQYKPKVLIFEICVTNISEFKLLNYYSTNHRFKVKEFKEGYESLIQI